VSGRFVATIGAFDGVHRGHQWLLGQVAERARNLSVGSVAVTFDPHPDLVLYPERHLSYLADRDEKEALIRALGVDEVLVLEFTRELSMLSAQQFIDGLQARYPLEELWVGPDFAMGRGRAGTVSALADLGRAQGFAVHMVPPLRLDGEVVSSSYIRSLLAAGNVERANTLLGRPFAVCGEVVTGAQRGRQLGFPTANVVPPANRAIPADGVYAAIARWDDQASKAVVNLGSRPTFGEEPRLLEAHLIGVSADLYGSRVCVEFTRRVRGIKKFGSIDELRAQIAADRDEAAKD
jgi:riboflavin kinase / FMN adenylyltransferase